MIRRRERYRASWLTLASVTTQKRLDNIEHIADSGTCRHQAAGGPHATVAPLRAVGPAFHRGPRFGISPGYVANRPGDLSDSAPGGVAPGYRMLRVLPVRGMPRFSVDHKPHSSMRWHQKGAALCGHPVDIAAYDRAHSYMRHQPSAVRSDRFQMAAHTALHAPRTPSLLLQMH